MKVCTQNVVKIKREIVAVDADVFCEGFDGDSRGAVEFVFNPILECDGDLFFFLCPNFILVSIAPPRIFYGRICGCGDF